MKFTFLHLSARDLFKIQAEKDHTVQELVLTREELETLTDQLLDLLHPIDPKTLEIEVEITDEISFFL